jgi:hypothetical protein
MPFNSTFKSPGKGLDRSSFKRKSPMSKTSIAKAVGEPVKAKPRKAMKASRPKATPIRQSAEHEDCNLRLLGVCRVEPGNVVWAHSNRSEHGKGAGLKAEDQYGCYACFWCHAVYDRQMQLPSGMDREHVENEFTRAMAESRAKLKKKGLLP